MSDAAFLLEVLSDGEPHSQATILRRAFDELGHGLTIHSRASDLRKQGHLVICERVPGRSRGEAWVYTLLGTLPESDPPGTDGQVSGSDSGSDPKGDPSPDRSGGSPLPSGAGRKAEPQPCPAPSLFEQPMDRPAWA